MRTFEGFPALYGITHVPGIPLLAAADELEIYQQGNGAAYTEPTASPALVASLARFVLPLIRRSSSSLGLLAIGVSCVRRDAESGHAVSNYRPIYIS